MQMGFIYILIYQFKNSLKRQWSIEKVLDCINLQLKSNYHANFTKTETTQHQHNESHNPNVVTPTT